MKQYLAILEKSQNGYGAYVNEFPGCGVVGETKEEAISLLKEALQLHLESLKQTNIEIPESNISAELIEI